MTIINIIENRINEGRLKAFYPAHYQLKLWKAPYPESNELGGPYNIEEGAPKLEGTIGEHWSTKWERIVRKYQLIDGSTIVPEDIPAGVWIDIQTPADDRIRRGSGKIWAIPAECIYEEPFEVNWHIVRPLTSMLCVADKDGKPTLAWGCWPVNNQVFKNTYVPW